MSFMIVFWVTHIYTDLDVYDNILKTILFYLDLHLFSAISS